MTIAITGASGFLGWHTMLAVKAQGFTPVPVQPNDIPENCQKLIHLAGVNRGNISENINITYDLIESLTKLDNPPKLVVFANSIQAGNESEYGNIKAWTASVLADVCQSIGSDYLDLKLPNLFGEHGKPYYNMVTSTFCHQLAVGEKPEIQDKELTLLHAQDAADLLVGNVTELPTTKTTVAGLLFNLKYLANTYESGEIPDLTESFQRDLFNTYRSHVSPVRQAKTSSDFRGSFIETTRSLGGQSQASFSTTLPKVVRGNHYHRRKFERFTVLSGNAVISLRKLFSNVRLDIKVTGDDPMSVDIPTGWAHSIKNTGSKPLHTVFWTNDLFDPQNPDTFDEVV